MDETKDSLQIKIDRVRIELSAEILRVIDAVDWKKVILEMRESKGYTFEQLGDLEIATELLLCGLITPVEYPEELEKKMGVSKSEVQTLVNEMNDKVFAKIREELIKTSGRTEIKPLENETKEVSHEDREELLQHIEQPELIAGGKPKEFVHPMIVQKMSEPVQAPGVKTEHTPENISKPAPTPATVAYPPKKDPYREIPE